MRGRKFSGTLIVVASLVLATVGQAREAWREAWQSSPQADLLGNEESIARFAKAIGIPADTLRKIQPKPISGTVRYRLRVYAAGRQLRIRLSNEEGLAPLAITAASVAIAGKDYNASGPIRRITFGGISNVTLPAGTPAIGDPVELSVRPGQDVLVSLSLAGEVRPIVSGVGAAIAKADQVMQPELDQAKIVETRPLVTGVSVLGEEKMRVIVAFGDSITDGNRRDYAALQSCPERLSQRLEVDRPGRWSVVNAGISGNCLLQTFMGSAGLARLDRDALRIEGVSHILLLEGINDIGRSDADPIPSQQRLSADNLIWAYRQIIARAHARNIKVVLATLLPTQGSRSHYSEEKNAIRQAVNHWIRTSGEPDAVVDFDTALRDPLENNRLKTEFDSGDHLHPNAAGSKAMADAINMAIFK